MKISFGGQPSAVCFQESFHRGIRGDTPRSPRPNGYLQRKQITRFILFRQACCVAKFAKITGGQIIVDMKKLSSPPFIAITLITLAGFALRLAYLWRSNPFIDEFTTALAAQMILQKGLPILPSGLFYEHGILFSYLAAPFVAFAGPENIITLARIPSLLIGTATIPLLYRIGKRWFAPWVGLIAAALLAFSPEGMVWGGRARMYALAQLLVLLTAFFAFEGARRQGDRETGRQGEGEQGSRGAGEQGRQGRQENRGTRDKGQGTKDKGQTMRWLALLALLLALLTQFGTLMFVPPILAGMAAVTGIEGRRQKAEGRKVKEKRNSSFILHPSSFILHPSSFILQGVALAAVIGVGMLVKRLGQPLGMAQLGEAGASSPFIELWNTLAYQVGVTLDWGSTVKFLSRQFGVPHHLWLTIVALLGFGVFIMLLLIHRASAGRKTSLAAQPSSLAYIFVWLVFGLTMLEMILFLEPFRRNPRYVVMGLPLFYLLTAAGLKYLLLLIKGWFALMKAQTGQQHWQRYTFRQAAMVFFGVLLVVMLPGLWKDLLIAWRTPEPPYNLAFQYVAQHRQPGDALLTMNTSGAALYLDHVDYFAIQNNAEQFLLNYPQQPVDRWLGAPWLGSVGDFNRLLNESEAWFVVDTQRLTTFGFYPGDWLATLDTQMEQVWAQEGALVYHTRVNRSPIPTEAEIVLDAQLGDAIRLDGYALDAEQSPPQLALFWSALSPIESDYTVFIHLRDAANNTLAQWDSQPLNGAYPTSQWLPGEMVIDPVSLTLPESLPPGEYYLAIGMYDLNTLERLPVAADVSGENAVLIPLSKGE